MPALDPRILAVLGVTAPLVLLGCNNGDDSGDSNAACADGISADTLSSKAVSAGPTLDGVADEAAWDCLDTLEIDLAANIVYTPEGAPVQEDGGVWTLEMSRSLTTSAGAEEDVQFDDLGAEYLFGVAVFDNTQINHAVHDGVLKLVFLE